MAFDQNSVPKDLRVLNVAPIMVEETLISPASVTSPPTPDSASDYFYPASAPASTAWCVRPILPEEDLDALVSIACPDDVENMMEEYGKLVERSPDGSAKLRM
ncbi:hypothetical protein TSUD_195920 [Trifolium subterraneum]|nr:hypothetical protein TSUD_195920 [Trifolium subterraneum]